MTDFAGSPREAPVRRFHRCNWQYIFLSWETVPENCPDCGQPLEVRPPAEVANLQTKEK